MPCVGAPGGRPADRPRSATSGMPASTNSSASRRSREPGHEGVPGQGRSPGGVEGPVAGAVRRVEDLGARPPGCRWPVAACRHAPAPSRPTWASTTRHHPRRFHVICESAARRARVRCGAAVTRSSRRTGPAATTAPTLPQDGEAAAPATDGARPGVGRRRCRPEGTRCRCPRPCRRWTLHRCRGVPPGCQWRACASGEPSRAWAATCDRRAPGGGGRLATTRPGRSRAKPGSHQGEVQMAVVAPGESNGGGRPALARIRAKPRVVAGQRAGERSSARRSPSRGRGAPPIRWAGDSPAPRHRDPRGADFEPLEAGKACDLRLCGLTVQSEPHVGPRPLGGELRRAAALAGRTRATRSPSSATSPTSTTRSWSRRAEGPAVVRDRLSDATARSTRRSTRSTSCRRPTSPRDRAHPRDPRADRPLDGARPRLRRRDGSATSTSTCARGRPTAS